MDFKVAQASVDARNFHIMIDFEFGFCYFLFLFTIHIV